MASVPLPAWVTDIRPHQADAVAEACELYRSGVQVVFMDAPTGSGKTLIAELIRREMNWPSLYMASDNTLVDQVARDFPYAKVIKGKGNYPTQNRLDLTADDCTSKGPGSPCWYCDEFYLCPYQKAKNAAITAPLGITNTAFMLSEANFVGKFSGKQLIIADEADTLESMLMGFVEFNVSRSRLKEFDMDEPGKGVHKATLVAWLDQLLANIHPHAVKAMQSQATDAAKKLRRLNTLSADVKMVADELRKEIARKQAGESEGKWLRDYDDRNGGLILKPVMVDSYGTRKLWRHAKHWLAMSATIISSDEMADSLGLPLSYATVKVPMTFPVENRPVIVAPVANVVYKEMGQAIPLLATAIRAIMRKHPNDRILIHTVSYDLANKLVREVSQCDDPAIYSRTLVTYTDGRDRERSLATYKREPGAVMFAPSMSRGVDLPGDLCRVQVIAKVPFLSLRDAQVSRRIHLPGGEMWYAVQAVRDIVQMTGRGVRSKTDHATTYILDAQFAKNLWRKHKGLFPEWWAESVITNQSIKEFL